MTDRSDTKHMKLALKLARKAKDKTYPNPMVGAVIVKNGKVIGRGYHSRAGEEHAEIKAIADVSGTCSGAEMFVTLEPCDHYGKTPPCTRTIIESGISAVHVAIEDPNPLNSGRGIRRLKKAGISVSLGLRAEEAAELNRKYIKFITTGLPYVTVKLAQSVDGKIAARDGTSKWISSDASRKYVRKIRSGFDAIVVGANTAVKDDPLLLDVKGRSPSAARVVVDTRLKIPAGANIFKTADKGPVIVGTTELACVSKIEKLRQVKGVEVVVTKSKKTKVPLKIFLRALARKGIVNVLVEGGGELTGSLMDESLVDEVMFFIAPKIIGGPYSSVKGNGVPNIAEAIHLRNIEVKRYGGDIFVRGLV
ncbi:MAG: bifunctional diaminohydroxyphosphoribosylaminopyrimidine deaminase/5-amino-6-(5-phosphoribosylamino)uracil reductase RibD [Candidatus Omnitrophota bacterium]